MLKICDYFFITTPMYNSYKEIIWIINLLNINDNRSEIRVQDVFTPDGNLKLIIWERSRKRIVN